jgi:hypothetical protein
MAANFSLSVGVYIGLKAADKILWNPKKYD